MRHDRESANLPFGADNLKLTWCNFKSSASAAAGKNKRYTKTNFRRSSTCFVR